MANLEALNKELAKLARRANRRIERAGSGQRSAISSYQERGYTRGWDKGRGKFRSGKASTVKEALERLGDLEDFLESKTSTIRGWREIVDKNVNKTNETLKKMGYDFTQKELKTILKETKARSSKEFYKILDIMQAYKSKGGIDDFSNALLRAKQEKISESEALERRLLSRKNV